MNCPKCRIMLSFDGRIHECEICGYTYEIDTEKEAKKNGQI